MSEQNNIGNDKRIATNYNVVRSFDCIQIHSQENTNKSRGSLLLEWQTTYFILKYFPLTHVGIMKN